MRKWDKKEENEPVSNKEFARITYAFVGLFLCMAIYLVYFQVVQSSDIINSPYNPRQDLLAENVIRGDIYDRNGKLLAETVIAEDGTESRYYPYQEVFAHAIGHNIYGKAGVELTENFTLLTSHAFFGEKIINELADNKDVGDNVFTTLDAELQQAAYDALGDYEGGIVVLEADTGKILTLVSKGSFDPNTVANEWDSLNNNESSVLYNRASQGDYAPGSVFKIVTALDYIRTNVNYESYSYECNGYIDVHGTRINCANDTVHGVQNLEQAFANSCNAAFADIGLSLEFDSYKATAEDLLFNQELPGDVITNPSSFALNKDSDFGKIMMTAIGQGDTLTNPYHMALISAAIANGGKLMTPYIVERVENHTGSIVKEYEPEVYKDIMTSAEALQLSEYMSGVTSYGTADNLQNDNYSIAGKTGTAEYSSNKDENHSWFTGFTNVDDPELVIGVIVEKSNGNKRAKDVAKKVLDAYYK